MKELKPIIDKPEYSKKIEEAISYYLYSLIFKDLLDYMKLETNLVIKNAKTAYLTRALETGKIQYVDGYLIGTFNSKLTKEIKLVGGKYSKLRKAFKVDISKLPIELRSSISVGANLIRTRQDTVLEILKQTERNADGLTYSFDFTDTLNPIFQDLNNQMVKTTYPDISLIPTFTEAMKAELVVKYNENMNLAIKNFTNNEIFGLRSTVEKEVFEGFRADKIEKIIRNKYNTTVNKAKFLARQETSLLVSKYREERYKDAGVSSYKWSTSGDERVRDRHKDLNGKVFTWDSPPITDQKTGNRNHPGEDYLCRCVAIPILTF